MKRIQDKIAEIQDQGYCILREHVARPLIDACRDAFWPVLLAYLEHHGHEPNRGPQRHFLPMPFEPPCFAPEFFFDNEVLSIVRSVMDDRAVADQWGCDVALRGSDYQGIHVDYQRPLFGEAPDLSLPAYVLVVNFGLVRITPENGPIEIAPGTHRMPRKEALRAVEAAFAILGRCTEGHRMPPTHPVPLLVSVMCDAGMRTAAARSMHFHMPFGSP